MVCLGQGEARLFFVSPGNATVGAFATIGTGETLVLCEVWETVAELTLLVCA
jgi:hypothetical protein